MILQFILIAFMLGNIEEIPEIMRYLPIRCPGYHRTIVDPAIMALNMGDTVDLLKEDFSRFTIRLNLLRDPRQIIRVDY